MYLPLISTVSMNSKPSSGPCVGDSRPPMPVPSIPSSALGLSGRGCMLPSTSSYCSSGSPVMTSPTAPTKPSIAPLASSMPLEISSSVTAAMKSPPLAAVSSPMDTTLSASSADMSTAFCKYSDPPCTIPKVAAEIAPVFRAPAKSMSCPVTT